LIVQNTKSQTWGGLVHCKAFVKLNENQQGATLALLYLLTTTSMLYMFRTSPILAME